MDAIMVVAAVINQSMLTSEQMLCLARNSDHDVGIIPVK